MPNGDMLDFSQVQAELQISEAELQNLIARGDLRAFRAGGTMKFRREDVDSLKRERATEPTIIIPAGGATPAPNVEVPDLGVDDSAATVVPEAGPGGAPTVQMPSGTPDSGTEEIVFEDSDLELMPIEDDAAVTAEVPAQEAPAGTRRSSRRAGAAEAAAPAMPSRRVQAAYAVEPGNPLIVGGLVATTLIFVFLAFVFAVMLWKGYYSEEARSSYVPGFLQGIVESLKDW